MLSCNPVSPVSSSGAAYDVKAEKYERLSSINKLIESCCEPTGLPDKPTCVELGKVFSAEKDESLLGVSLAWRESCYPALVDKVPVSLAQEPFSVGFRMRVIDLLRYRNPDVQIVGALVEMLRVADDHDSNLVVEDLAQLGENELVILVPKLLHEKSRLRDRLLQVFLRALKHHLNIPELQPTLLELASVDRVQGADMALVALNEMPSVEQDLALLATENRLTAARLLGTRKGLCGKRAAELLQLIAGDKNPRVKLLVALSQERRLQCNSK